METWHEVLLKPYASDYTDAYLVTAAYSRAYRESHEGALRTEWEVNATYNFGEQDHWELNVAPIKLRWHRFPWSDHVRTSVAFGVGLSYAFDFPEVEYELENDTQQFLIFWMLEITAGPREGPWSAVLRLHHRSPAWGLMGVDDGGMNAPSAWLSLRVLKPVLPRATGGARGAMSVGRGSRLAGTRLCVQPDARL